MKTQQNLRELIIASLFVCLGIVIPYFTGHAYGIEGTVLLPMHIPVLIAGLILGARYGAICGLLTPILSSLLTGMPALWPTLPMMAVELVTYGFLAGLLRKKMKFSLYPSLLIAMIAGRILKGAAFAIIMMPTGLDVIIESVVSATVVGIPGIVIQLAFIPLTVKLLEKHLWVLEGGKSVDKIDKFTESKAINEAIKSIKDHKDTLIIVKDDQIIYRDAGMGVQPILNILNDEEKRKLLEGSIVVDKIIGKGAALLFALEQIEGVYGLTMSKSAKEYLDKRNIKNSYTRCVDALSDRTGRGICPIEKSVLDIDDPMEGYVIIQETISGLMAKIS